MEKLPKPSRPDPNEAGDSELASELSQQISALSGDLLTASSTAVDLADDWSVSATASELSQQTSALTGDFLTVGSVATELNSAAAMVSEISSITVQAGDFAAAFSDACAASHICVSSVDLVVSSSGISGAELSALQERIAADRIAMEEALPSNTDYWVDLHAFSTFPCPVGLGLAERDFWLMTRREWLARYRVWKAYRDGWPSRSTEAASGDRSDFEPPQPPTATTRKALEAVQAPDADGSTRKPWNSIAIWFLDQEHVQVTVPGETKRLSYAEMGFGDRRGMKVGDRGPKQAWGWLRTFAEKRGTIDLPERQSAPAPMGPRDADRQPSSSHEVLIAGHAGAAKARARLQVAMKELRRSLCSFFEIEDNPILFEGTCYRVQFPIGCSPSYHS